jgi:Stress responsive A/B Barrel Domain
MIRHIVLFNLKPEVEPSDRDWLFGQMQALSKIPGVKKLAVNKLLEAREDWYRSRISTDYQWGLFVEFDDEDGLYVYQQHPDHVVTAQEIRKRVSGTKVIDLVNVT